MKKIAASDSRQSVGLKWKTRKGLEKLIDFEGKKTKVGGDLEVDGNILSGLIGKATLPFKMGPMTVATLECWVCQGIDSTAGTPDDPYHTEPFLFAIASSYDEGGAKLIFSPICTRYASETDYDLCRTMEDLLEKGFIPNVLANEGTLVTDEDIEPFTSVIEEIQNTTSKAKYQHTVDRKSVV